MIASGEGTAQGDIVAMAIFAIGLLKMQDHIKFNRTKVKQAAYADDLTGAGMMEGRDCSSWPSARILLKRH